MPDLFPLSYEAGTGQWLQFPWVTDGTWSCLVIAMWWPCLLGLPQWLPLDLAFPTKISPRPREVKSGHTASWQSPPRCLTHVSAGSDLRSRLQGRCGVRPLGADETWPCFVSSFSVLMIAPAAVSHHLSFSSALCVCMGGGCFVCL